MKIRFGDFEFDRNTGELWEGGTAIRLQPQPAKVLEMLVAHPGELLSQISGLARRNPTRLAVIDPMTARKFKDTQECIIEIGSQLGADYVLLGDVQQSNHAVKVDAQLFRVSINRQVWATEEIIPQDSGFSKVWPAMTNSISSVLEIGDVAKR